MTILPLPQANQSKIQLIGRGQKRQLHRQAILEKNLTAKRERRGKFNLTGVVGGSSRSGEVAEQTSWRASLTNQRRRRGRRTGRGRRPNSRRDLIEAVRSVQGTLLLLLLMVLVVVVMVIELLGNRDGVGRRRINLAGRLGGHRRGIAGEASGDEGRRRRPEFVVGSSDDGVDGAGEERAWGRTVPGQTGRRGRHGLLVGRLRRWV